MPLSATLWDACDPPAIWLEVKQPERPESDQREVVLRIKETGRRSISASVYVSRYSPESSIFRAVCGLLEELAVRQVVLTSSLVRDRMVAMVERWVDPF